MFFLILCCAWIAEPAIEIACFMAHMIATEQAWNKSVKQTAEENNVLAITALADALEDLLSHPSIKFDPRYRHRISRLVSLARQIVATRTAGPSIEFVSISNWPFSPEGKVEL